MIPVHCDQCNDKSRLKIKTREHMIAPHEKVLVIYAIRRSNGYTTWMNIIESCFLKVVIIFILFQ